MNQAQGTNRRTVLITGCSRGIGLEIAKLFAEKGSDWNVVATMRNKYCQAGVDLAAVPNVTVLPLDVTSKASVDAAIIQVPGGIIDVLVNNAGYALVGALELATEDQIMKQYSTNVFGCIRTMQAVLPSMRKRRSGVIVQISSVGARVTLPLGGLYQSTKFALEGLSETCAMELKPLNIKMRIVEPGFVKTDFGKAMVFTNDSNESDKKEYEGMTKNFKESIRQFAESGSTAETVAKVVYEAATSNDNKLRWPVGEDVIKIIKNRAMTSDEEHMRGYIQKMKLDEAASES